MYLSQKIQKFKPNYLQFTHKKLNFILAKGPKAIYLTVPNINNVIYKGTSLFPGCCYVIDLCQKA